MEKNRVRHMVIFNLKHKEGSPEEQKFLSDGKAILTSIPVVENFEVCRQISVKNNYQFGFSMEFKDKAAYNEYNNHPNHTAFVRDRWDKEVSSFLEIDFME